MNGIEERITNVEAMVAECVITAARTNIQQYRLLCAFLLVILVHFAYVVYSDTHDNKVSQAIHGYNQEMNEQFRTKLPAFFKIHGFSVDEMQVYFALLEKAVPCNANECMMFVESYGYRNPIVFTANDPSGYGFSVVLGQHSTFTREKRATEEYSPRFVIYAGSMHGSTHRIDEDGTVYSFNQSTDSWAIVEDESLRSSIKTSAITHLFRSTF